MPDLLHAVSDRRVREYMGATATHVTARSRNMTDRTVLTGGPGGGKTTAIDFFRREIGDSVVVVPELRSQPQRTEP